MKIEKIFLGNQKRRTHHRYAFSPRGFEHKQLIRILCEHKCALIFTLVADDLTNRCWVLTKTHSFYSLTKKRYASKTAMLILMYNSHYMSVQILSFRPISTNGQSATLAPLSRHCYLRFLYIIL